MSLADVETVIFCATKHESVAACRVQGGAPQPALVEGRRAVLGELAGRPCVTVASGLGLDALDRMFRAVTTATRPRLLVNFGAAGAIGRLPVGTLTIPREIVAYTWPDLKQEGETIVRPVEPLAGVAPGVRLTRAGSCPHDIRDASVRTKLQESLGIDTTDWETYRVALFCRSRHIEFVALRCVTDFSDESTAVSYGRNALRVLDAGAQLLEPLVAKAWETLVEEAPAP
jgi:nucleoside phosphorylase